MKRPLVTSKCQHLDINGWRCRRDATKAINVHEDPEAARRWFRVYVCEKHVRVP